MAAPGYGYLPQLLGQPATPDNIADSTVAWMPRWQNLKNPREEKFIRGYSVYMGAAVESSRDITARSKASARDSNAISSATTRLRSAPLIQAPTLPSPTNYVDIDPEKKDIFGIPSFGFIFSGARTNS